MKLTWTQRRPDLAERYLIISDGVETYYAILPPKMTEKQAVRQFISTYDHNRDADDPTPYKQLDAELRLALSWIRHEPGDPDPEEDWEYADKGYYCPDGTFMASLRHRYCIGTIGEAGFEGDTLGRDHDMTSFATEKAAVRDVKKLIREWPKLTYGEKLTDAAVFDDVTREVVWQQ